MSSNLPPEAAQVAQVARECTVLGLDDGYFGARAVGYQADLVALTRATALSPLLEIGGFPFHFSRCLQLAGYDVRTVDLDPERSRPWLDAHGIRAIRCDIEREPLPCADASVATVVLAETFEHLRVNPLFALREMARVLRPGGLLYLTTPNFYRLGNVLRFVLGRGLSNDPLYEYDKLETVGHMGHVREYTARELSAFLTRAGFQRIAVTRRVMPSQHGRWVDLLHHALPRLRPELVLTARRA